LATRVVADLLDLSLEFIAAELPRCIVGAFDRRWLQIRVRVRIRARVRVRARARARVRARAKARASG
jgi:hypothetical protein